MSSLQGSKVLSLRCQDANLCSWGSSGYLDTPGRGWLLLPFHRDKDDWENPKRKWDMPYVTCFFSCTTSLLLVLVGVTWFLWVTLWKKDGFNVKCNSISCEVIALIQGFFLVGMLLLTVVILKWWRVYFHSAPSHTGSYWEGVSLSASTPLQTDFG